MVLRRLLREFVELGFRYLRRVDGVGSYCKQVKFPLLLRVRAWLDVFFDRWPLVLWLGHHFSPPLMDVLEFLLWSVKKRK